MGASSFSPSPMTTTPAMVTVSIIRRMASTAAWSAPILSPRPIHRAAPSAAASVTRTSSRARFRSGAEGGVGTTGSGARSFAISVMASSFQAVQEAGRTGGVEQDPVDLGVQGHVHPALLGQPADVAGGLHPLHG